MIEKKNFGLKTFSNEEIRDLYRGHKTDPVALAGGIMGVFMMALIMLSLPAIARNMATDKKPDAKPFEFIEARLLRLGEIKDKDKLPDRIVPALPTAPDEILPLDQNENKPPPPPQQKSEKQREAVLDDKLRQVFDKAKAFAEIQDNVVPEGAPDGVQDGDVSDASLASIGDTYMRKLSRIFYERLNTPTLISEAELKKLKAQVLIRFDIDMSIASSAFVKKSGNALWDDAIQNAIDRVRTEVGNLPPPPEAIAAKIFSGGIIMKFHGAEAGVGEE